MRAISLWEPWATLIVTGEKRIETRAWAAQHYGPLAIHATKKAPAYTAQVAQSEPFRSALLRHGLRSWELDPFARNLGCIIGVVEVVGYARTGTLEVESMIRKLHAMPEAQRQEYAFGDFSDDRWAWELANPIRLEHPVGALGKQGTWTLDAAVQADVEHGIMLARTRRV